MTRGSYVALILLLNFTNYIVLFRYIEHVFAILMLMWCHDLKLSKFLETKFTSPKCIWTPGPAPKLLSGFSSQSLFCEYLILHTCSIYSWECPKLTLKTDAEYLRQASCPHECVVKIKYISNPRGKETEFGSDSSLWSRGLWFYDIDQCVSCNCLNLIRTMK